VYLWDGFPRRADIFSGCGITDMKTLTLVATAAAAAFSAFAQQTPSFSGTWVLQKDSNIKLVLEQTPDKIHVQELKGGEVVTEYTCNLDGKDCAIKEEGHPAKVALWFNGPKLVELRTRGGEITRRRFTLDAGGKLLNVEMSPMSSQGKTEILAYSK
jgi:hypothetical protein